MNSFDSLFAQAVLSSNFITLILWGALALGAFVFAIIFLNFGMIWVRALTSGARCFGCTGRETQTPEIRSRGSRT